MGYSRRDLEKYRGVAFRTAMAVLRDEDESNDISQETLRRLVCATNPPDSPVAWCYTIAKNLSLNHQRDVVRRRQLLEAQAKSEETPEPNYERSLWLVELLGALPRRVADALFHALQGLSSKEIADLLGVCERTIRDDLRRARTLAQRIDREV